MLVKRSVLRRAAVQLCAYQGGERWEAGCVVWESADAVSVLDEGIERRRRGCVFAVGEVRAPFGQSR